MLGFVITVALGICLIVYRLKEGSVEAGSVDTTKAGTETDSRSKLRDRLKKLRLGKKEEVLVVLACLVAFTASLLFLRHGAPHIYHFLVGTAFFWFLVFIIIFTAITAPLKSNAVNMMKNFLIISFVGCLLVEGFHGIPDLARHWGEKRALLGRGGNQCVSASIPPYHHLEWQMDVSKTSSREPVKDNSGNLIWTACILSGVDTVWVTTRVREGLVSE
jgi:hypothetical protein